MKYYLQRTKHSGGYTVYGCHRCRVIRATERRVLVELLDIPDRPRRFVPPDTIVDAPVEVATRPEKAEAKRVAVAARVIDGQKPNHGRTWDRAS